MAFNHGNNHRKGIGNGIVADESLVFLVDPQSDASWHRPGISSTFKDVSGLGNHGTINGAPTYDVADGGMTLDGSNDYIVHGDDASIDLTTAASYCMWIKPGAGGNYRPFCRDDGGTHRNWWFYMYGGGGLPGTMWFSVMSGGANKAISHASSYNTDAWYYYVGTYSTLSGTILYRNGASVGTNSFTGNADNDDVSLGVGAYANGSHKFSGKIGTFSIYNKKLSAAEVLRNYNAQKGRYGL